MILPEIYSQLEEAEISKQEADIQYKLLTSGVHFIQLDRAAVPGDGIRPLPIEEAHRYAQSFEKHRHSINIQKFVPASGAASRMFKELIVFATERKSSKDIDTLFNSIGKLAFYSQLPQNASRAELAGFILDELGYQFTPKGLIPFHSYSFGSRTPFEEHWVEGSSYAETGGRTRIHFTVSEEHYDAFLKLYNRNAPTFEKNYKVQLDIDYSYQKKSTDTIAIDHNNNIVMDEKGEVLRRPGGHGALIQNLNSIEADLIFVKNIDNVTHESRLAPTVLYKKALAGILLELKDKIFDQLNAIDKKEAKSEELEKVGEMLMIEKPSLYEQWNKNEQIEFWKKKLNRPIRICGMVKNEGEPGGGPFWVKEGDGTSLQIVESAQIDRSDSKQESIFQESTHFNPVDLVCYVNDYQGNKFNLLEFVDQSAAFITSKSYNGTDITVLERPGLWNGAMAYWNTVFVEVPIETFNPVKTINDLLKPAHQKK